MFLVTDPSSKIITAIDLFFPVPVIICALKGANEHPSKTVEH